MEVITKDMSVPHVIEEMALYRAKQKTRIHVPTQKIGDKGTVVVIS